MQGVDPNCQYKYGVPRIIEGLRRGKVKYSAQLLKSRNDDITFHITFLVAPREVTISIGPPSPPAPESEWLPSDGSH